MAVGNQIAKRRLAISHRAEAIVQAEIRAMSVECERVQGVNLAQGVCDTEIPEVVRRAAQECIETGSNTYTRYDGTADLREAIAGKMRAENGVSCNAETDVVVSAGSTGALYCACLALLNPGDEVVLFEPYYGYHLNTLQAVEAVPRYVTMQPPTWEFSIEQVEQVITSRTRAILLNSPGNPSGKVFTRAELEAIADLAIRHDLFVFSDEIYEYFLYDRQVHISPQSLPGMEERTITVSGYSKTFSITGWRIGYSVSDPRWARMIGYVNDLIYVCAPAPLQAGVAKGIRELPREFYTNLAAEYKSKRDLLCNTLAELGLDPFVPGGAYYVLADVSRVPGSTSKEKAMHILAQTGVATVPGDAFYHGLEGARQVRFCFAKKQEDLVEACARLRRLR